MPFRELLKVLLSLILTCCQTPPIALKVTPALPVSSPQEMLPVPVVVHSIGSAEIAVFLPLTGMYQALGEELLKTIQLAYVTLPHPGYHLAIYDTKGTSEGTLEAYKSLKVKPRFIIGPVFSQEVKALVNADSSLPVILTFSNDETIHHPQVFLLGLSPRDQMYTVLDHAKNQGYRPEEMIGIFPQNDYGKLLKTSLSTSEPSIKIFMYDKEDKYFRSICEKIKDIPVRILIIPEGPPIVSQLLQSLAFAEFNFEHVRILGSALWDKGGGENSLTSKQDPQLLRAWFAAPDPHDRFIFEQQYKKFYKEFPSRFAVLGAASIEIANDIFAALRQDATITVDQYLRQITFNTVEGTYHFKDDGSSKRSLAVLEIHPKGTIVVNSGIKNLVSQVKSDHTQPVPQIAS